MVRFTGVGEATTDAPGSLHYAGADRWVSMPNGAQGGRGRGRASVEAGPTPAPWRSAPTLKYTDLAVMDHPAWLHSHPALLGIEAVARDPSRRNTGDSIPGVTD